jgi:hypothetical protein
MSEWVYVRSEPGLWTVGFYRPDGRWESDSDHDDRDEAAKRVRWLNGGNDAEVGEEG